MPSRIVIADDHPIVREGLKTFLTLQKDLEVVGEAESCAQILKLSQSCQPDLILLDVQLSDGNSLSLLPSLLEQQPKPKIVILSSYADESHIREAMRKGASGYLLKHAGPNALLDQIRSALRGEKPLDSSALAVLSQSQEDPLEALTKREFEVLQLIAAGLNNKQIAQKLEIAEKTVKTHASSIFAKLKVRDRTQAALLAKERKL